jgi:hypothetical protein
MAEGYFQHAEHYFRILNAMNQAQQQGGPQQGYQQRRYQNGPDQEGGDAGDQPEVTVHHAGHPAGQAIEAELEAEQRERDPRD